MAQLQSITRILVLGKTKREGPSLKCLSDKSSLRLILSSSLDGKLWSPFGTYNQVHDRLTEVFETKYHESEYLGYSRRHTWRFLTPVAAIGENRQQVCPVRRWKFFADRGDKIAPETVKMPTLLLVEDRVTSRPKNLARGHYNRGAIFQNACVAFCQCYTEINKLD